MKGNRPFGTDEAAAAAAGPSIPTVDRAVASPLARWRAARAAGDPLAFALQQGGHTPPPAAQRSSSPGTAGSRARPPHADDELLFQLSGLKPAARAALRSPFGSAARRERATPPARCGGAASGLSPAASSPGLGSPSPAVCGLVARLFATASAGEERWVGSPPAARQRVPPPVWATPPAGGGPSPVPPQHDAGSAQRAHHELRAELERARSAGAAAFGAADLRRLQGPGDPLRGVQEERAALLARAQRAEAGQAAALGEAQRARGEADALARQLECSTELCRKALASRRAARAALAEASNQSACLVSACVERQAAAQALREALRRSEAGAREARERVALLEAQLSAHSGQAAALWPHWRLPQAEHGGTAQDARAEEASVEAVGAEAGAATAGSTRGPSPRGGAASAPASPLAPAASAPASPHRNSPPGTPVEQQPGDSSGAALPVPPAAEPSGASRGSSTGAASPAQQPSVAGVEGGSPRSPVGGVAGSSPRDPRPPHQALEPDLLGVLDRLQKQLAAHAARAAHTSPVGKRAPQGGAERAASPEAPGGGGSPAARPRVAVAVSGRAPGKEACDPGAEGGARRAEGCSEPSSSSGDCAGDPSSSRRRAESPALSSHHVLAEPTGAVTDERPLPPLASAGTAAAKQPGAASPAARPEGAGPSRLPRRVEEMHAGRSGGSAMQQPAELAGCGSLCDVERGREAERRRLAGDAAVASGQAQCALAEYGAGLAACPGDAGRQAALLLGRAAAHHQLGRHLDAIADCHLAESAVAQAGGLGGRPPSHRAAAVAEAALRRADAFGALGAHAAALQELEGAAAAGVLRGPAAAQRLRRARLRSAGAGGGEAPDPYAVLGLQPGAGGADVRRAYRALALRFHPDKAGPALGRPAAEALFRLAADAAAALQDPAMRRVHELAAAHRGGAGRRARATHG